LILTAEDDPFVPIDPFRDPSVVNNRFVTVVITPNGGHCAFVERRCGEYDGYWAEREVVRFVTAMSATPLPASRAHAVTRPDRQT